MNSRAPAGGHRHRPYRVTYGKYQGCVAPDNCNSKSHGGPTKTSHCRCGATRVMNTNGSHFERTDWTEPTEGAEAPR